MRVLMLPLRTENPYTSIIADGLGAGTTVTGYDFKRLNRSADVLHVHWLEQMSRPIMDSRGLGLRLRWLHLALTTAATKRRGAVVWTAHNLAPHEALPPPVAAAQARHAERFLRQVDLAIAMSATQLGALRAAFPAIAADRWRVIAHPHYRGVFPPESPRSETRERLGIGRSARVVAMIGRLRPYKGTEEAIAAFRRVARDGDVMLIAGECRDASLRAHLEMAARETAAIRLLLGKLDDAELSSLFRTADLALYNFTAILNSGSLLAALSLDCPVLAPLTPTFAETAAQNPDWVTLFGPGQLDTALRAGLDRAANGPPPGRPDLSAHEPGRIGEMHLKVYEEALQLRRGGR